MTRAAAGLRLFVALDPPPAVRDALAGWLRAQRSLRPLVRAVPAEDLHVTLAFLGTREPHELDAIRRAVVATGAVGAASGLRTGGPAWLPPRRPRALAVELHDDRGDVADLRSTLLSALGGVTGERAGRSFRPHLTVARRRPASPLPTAPLAPTPALRFAAASLTLYRSTLDPDRARYSVVERVRWGEGTDGAG